MLVLQDIWVVVRKSIPKMKIAATVGITPYPGKDYVYIHAKRNWHRSQRRTFESESYFMTLPVMPSKPSFISAFRSASLWTPSAIAFIPKV